MATTRSAARSRLVGRRGILVLLVTIALSTLVLVTPAVHPSAGPGSTLRPSLELHGPPLPVHPPPARPTPLGVHPERPPFGPTSFSGHYYAGSVYYGPNSSATNLAVEIQVPQDNAQSTDFYYVLLSVWDDAKSYDQIGFTNSYGMWEVTYSTTTACAGSYSFSTDAYNLNPDTAYVFDMQLVSQSVVFTVSLPTGGPIWSYTAFTGGNHFVLANTFYCNGGSSYDYTNYEEVYDTSAPVPPYAFFFTNNTENSASETQWVTWATSGAPASINVATGGSETIIENVPFGIAAAPTLTAEVGPLPRNYSETLAVAQYSPDSRLVPSISGSIPGARVLVTPPNGTAPVIFTLTVEVNASSHPGTGYSLEIEVTDTHGVYARIAVVVQLNPALSATAPVARPPSTDVNRTISVSESPAGGSGTDLFRWSGLPAGCANDTSTVSCIPHLSGTYTVGVEVSDSLGYFSNSTVLDLTVHPVLGLSASVNLTSVDVGQAVGYQALPVGGSGGLTVAWSSSSVGSCVAAGTGLTCIARSPGSLSETVTVTDIAGSRATAQASATVYSDPSAGLKASRTSVDAGRPTFLTVSGSGGELDAAGSTGLSNYGIAWTGLPSACIAGAPLVVECTWASTGTYPISARVVDANNFLSEPASLTVTVYPALSASVSQSPSDPLDGTTGTISAVVTGGYGTTHYAWTGLPSGCATTTGANLTCQFQGGGNYVVRVTVTDAGGGNASASGTLTVRPSFLGLPMGEGYGVLGGVLAAIAASVGIAAITVRRRRRSPPRGPVPEGSERPIR